jgi:hypothetical protein
MVAYSRSALAAENLFLRKQLALFQERKVKPHRADDATRWLMVTVSRLFDWRMSLIIVKPDTFIRWHRKGFRLFWRCKSKPTGRPRLPKELRELIRRMAAENPSWGEERIANELKLKLGIRVSSPTVATYLRHGPGWKPDPKQRWKTFVRNHAKAIVACDFFVVVTASFRTLYVFVIMQLGTRRILHHNVTDHPTAEWTLQQFREALPDDHLYRFVIHDRDSSFSPELDKGVTAMGVRVVRTPQANAICERFRRDPTPRMPGLPDSVERAASETHPEIMGNAFQPRQAAHESGSGDTGATTASPAYEWEPSCNPRRARYSQHGGSGRSPS